MATRKDIRIAFYDALETAVGAGTTSELVPADQISQESPETAERLPAIVHSADYRKYPMNEGSSAPIDVKRDAAGNATAEVYETYHEASFGLAILDTDEGHQEDIYEAIRTYFEKFEERPWDPSTIQSDIEWIRVLDATGEDDADVQPTIRGDRLIVRVGFARQQELDVTAITNFNTDLDADNDGTTDETY